MLTGIEFEAVDVARITFWILLPLALFARPKWAVLAWLAMANLDGTGPGIASDSNIGWVNFLKALVVPLFLCWRLRRVRGKSIAGFSGRMWLLFILYAAIASVWSPYPLAAAKIIANMIGIMLAVVVLERSARLGLLNAKVLSVFIGISLFLGFLQTTMYGSTAFGFDDFDQPARFTSFVGAQQYASLLVAFLAAVLWLPTFSTKQRLILTPAVLTALVLNGSRTWSLGALVVILIYTWLSFRKVFGYGVVFASLCLLCGLIVMNLGLHKSDSFVDPNSRLIATAMAVLSDGSAGYVGLGTFGFRMTMYQGLLDEIRAGSLWRFLFGYGTSSGGDVALRMFPQDYHVGNLDPNRTIHNEWLRVQYELGLLGLLIWSSTFFGLVITAVQAYRGHEDRLFAAALLSYLPALTLALSTENIFAGAGNAVTVGFSLLLGLMCAVHRSPARHRWTMAESDFMLSPAR